MNELLNALNYWHWLILAVVLVVLEMFAAGVIFLWLGIAAASMGALTFVITGISWETQLFIFSILSRVSVVAGKTFLRRHPVTTDQPVLNRRGMQYIGRVFTLDEPIVNGQGKIRVDDTSWKIEGDDCEAGSRIRVTAVDGVVMVVEKT